MYQYLIKTPSFRFSGATLAALLLASLTGCGGSSGSSGGDQPEPTPPSDTASYTEMNATQADAPVYLDLSSGHSVGETEAWQMAYQKYVGFMVNRGSTGSRGVTACIAKQYDELYTDGEPNVDAFSALNAQNTLADFQAVTRESCNDFTTDAVASQFQDWYTYDMNTHTITVHDNDSNGWILRSATDDGNGNYGYTRLKAVSYDGNGITFNSELWDNNTQTFQPAVSTGALDFSGGAVFWDMETNRHSEAEMPGWDLKIEKSGYGEKILVNGGASGNGDAGVGSALMVANVDAVTDPTDTNQVFKYFGDSASGPMSAPGSYGAFEYGVGGNNHDMWPTFAVYLFQDGERYYKAQVLSNYGAEGNQTSGSLYVRYQEVFE
ncbi:MAG: hypothetical protein ACP5D0_03320 [Hydrogenovibrio sp.]